MVAFKLRDKLPLGGEGLAHAPLAVTGPGTPPLPLPLSHLQSGACAAASQRAPLTA